MMLAQGLWRSERQGSTGAMKYAVEIDGEHMPPALIRQIIDRRVVGNRGIVDEDIDAAPARIRGVRHLRSTRRIGDIAT